MIVLPSGLPLPLTRVSITVSSPALGGVIRNAEFSRASLLPVLRIQFSPKSLMIEMLPFVVHFDRSPSKSSMMLGLSNSSFSRSKPRMVLAVTAWVRANRGGDGDDRCNAACHNDTSIKQL